MKRFVDLAVSVSALIALVPVFLVIALLVWLDDGFPVLFRQERVGRNGELFTIHKFRTMAASHGGPNFSVSGDSRITRIGGFLRRSKLDELPQLFDVATGRMSLVGPRPEVPEYVEKWPIQSRGIILSVRPGITDPASIEFRNESDLLSGQQNPGEFYERVILPRKVDLYVTYARRRTFLGDIRIIGRTLGAVFG